MARAKCLTSLLVASFAVSGATGRASAETGVESARCKVAIGRIVREAGAIVDHASPSGDNMFLSHPKAKDFVLFCNAYMPMMVSVNWDGAYPPLGYFALVATAGSAVVPDQAKTLLPAAIRCQTAALLARDESAEIETPRAGLECRAFTRDGGSTLITIGAKPPH